MEKGIIYTHFKGGKYTYLGIALPLSQTVIKEEQGIKKEMVRYHEDTKDLELMEVNGVWFIDHPYPCAIYESHQKWAREIDDFFGYKEDGGKMIKRFEREL